MFFSVLGQIVSIASNDATVKMYEIANGRVSSNFILFSIYLGLF